MYMYVYIYMYIYIQIHTYIYIYIYIFIVIFIFRHRHKHPGGPETSETVLVKARFFKEKTYGTVVKRDICSRKWIPKFGCFRVLPQQQLIFIGGFLWTLINNRFFKVSMVFFCKVALRFIYLHCKQTETVLLTTTVH